MMTVHQHRQQCRRTRTFESVYSGGIRNSFGAFEDKVTRLEVHLADENR
jgi:hypothetical protein